MKISQGARRSGLYQDGELTRVEHGVPQPYRLSAHRETDCGILSQAHLRRQQKLKNEVGQFEI
jgi:hypothetical protein